MEDSFKVRVDKVFGSLQSSSSSAQPPSSSSYLNSLWSLTDEEIERNRWLQDKVDPHKHTHDADELNHRLKNPKPFLPGLVAEPSSSSNYHDLESDLQELDDDDDDDDDDDENREKQVSKPDDHTNEEWDIRSSVGMDCTLDNEEEEDAYDKVAVGQEESADRFYMKSVSDYEVDIDSINELPSSFTDVTRDPRANHRAAKLRLKEDDESAKKMDLQVPESKIQEPNQIATEFKQQIVNEPLGSRSSVPDYLRNPSKYTRYTFDSVDNVDEASNRKAYMDFFSSLRKGSAAMEIEDDVSADSLTSVVFTPRKKSSDVVMKKGKVDGYEGKKAVPISIADADVDGDEICMMDEDSPEKATNKSSSMQKSGRRYRTKAGTSAE